MSDYRKLTVWQKSRELVVSVYRATGNFPSREMFGLTSQIRRAATSIPANIAEGSGRGSNTDFVRFLHIALGSTNELETHLLISTDLGFLSVETYEPLEQNLAEVRRMLNGLINHLSSGHH